MLFVLRVYFHVQVLMQIMHQSGGFGRIGELKSDDMDSDTSSEGGPRRPLYVGI